MPPFAAPLALGPLDAPSTSRASPTRARPASARPAPCAARGSSTRASSASAGRSCSPSWPRAASSARASSTCSSACSAAPPGPAGGRGLDPRRARRPARARAPPRLALPGRAGTSTGAWRACSASPSARSSPTRWPGGRGAGHERRRARRRRARPAPHGARARGARHADRAVSGADPALEEGWVDRELALEFPELRIVSVLAPAPGRRARRALRERLALLADRFHGARALTLRREPVPAAYRVFFRHVGLDPDAQRTPVEAAALDRLVQGGFVSHGPLEDALLVAVVETGVPVWALDDARLDGPLGLRGARAGERLGEGEYAADLRARAVVVADAARPGGGALRRRRARPRARSPPRAAAAVRRRGRRGARAARRGGAVRLRRGACVTRPRALPWRLSRLAAMLDVRDAPPSSPTSARRARQLRGQIAALEASSPTPSSAPSRTAGCTAPVPAPGGPRAADAGRARALRDALADRLAEARARARRARRAPGGQPGAARADAARARPLQVRAGRQPRSGRAGCGVWQVRPRLGLIGMLMGWWQVKLSSGCPLAS